MSLKHNLLVIALFLVSFMILEAWKYDQTISHSIQNEQKKDNTEFNTLENQRLLNISQDKIITVKTDVLLLKINTRGGDIEQAFLLTYADKLGSTQPLSLLKVSKEFIYQAQIGLIGKDGPDNPSNNVRPLYVSHKDTYLLKDNQNQLHVPLFYTTSNGIIYSKTFILKRGDFLLNIEYRINNNYVQPIQLALFGQLKQSDIVSNTKNIGIKNFILQTYRGAAYSTNYDKYQKYSFKDIKNKDLNIITRGGWIAMLHQYFATAWIPIIPEDTIFYTTYLNNNLATIGFKSSPINIAPGQKKYLKAKLWIGPEIQDRMATVSPHLDLTVNYGWLWFISQPLFKLLKFIHNYVGNWGVSIIVITLIVRGAMYPLTKAQYTSIVKMRMLQPKLIEIRERFYNDKHRQSQEIMTLYKMEKVNPLGGCLPLVIQMPIFLALYYMLSASIELRHAPFILWIHDLSAQDPYYVLAILMGITMFFIQKISPTTITDPIQKKIITFMPVIFTVFFLWLPSGMVIYYIISNLVTIFQQQIIYNKLDKYEHNK